MQPGGHLTGWRKVCPACQRDRLTRAVSQGLKPTWGPISLAGLSGAGQVTYGTAGLELQAWKQLGAVGPRVRSLAEAHQSRLQGLVAEMVSEQPAP